MIFNYGGTIYRKAEAPTIGQVFRSKPKADKIKENEAARRDALIFDMENFKKNNPGFFADAIPAATIRGDSGRVERFG